MAARSPRPWRDRCRAATDGDQPVAALLPVDRGSGTHARFGRARRRLVEHRGAGRRSRSAPCRARRRQRTPGSVTISGFAYAGAFAFLRQQRHRAEVELDLGDVVDEGHARVYIAQRGAPSVAARKRAERRAALPARDPQIVRRTRRGGSSYGRLPRFDEHPSADSSAWPACWNASSAPSGHLPRDDAAAGARRLRDGAIVLFAVWCALLGKHVEGQSLRKTSPSADFILSVQIGTLCSTECCPSAVGDFHHVRPSFSVR